MTGTRTRGRVWTWVRRTLLGLVAVVLLLVVGKGVQLATLEGRTARAATEALEASRESFGRRWPN